MSQNSNNPIPPQEACEITLAEKTEAARRDLEMATSSRLPSLHTEMLQDSTIQLSEDWLLSIFSAFSGSTTKALILYLYGALRDFKPLSLMMAEIKRLSLEAARPDEMRLELFRLYSAIEHAKDRHHTARSFTGALLNRCMEMESSSMRRTSS